MDGAVAALARRVAYGSPTLSSLHNCHVARRCRYHERASLRNWSPYGQKTRSYWKRGFSEYLSQFCGTTL